MPVTNTESGTRIDEIADGLYRISTPVAIDDIPGGFTFNQFLIAADQPLLFHTGLRHHFALTREAVAAVIDPASLRWVAFSHLEADECGALNLWLDAAPDARPMCSHLGAIVSIDDIADRPARGMGDGEFVDLGGKVVQWFDTPHLPHGMDAGYLFERTGRTLMCGDLFSQPGAAQPPITEDAGAIWEPSEAMRQAFAYAPITDAPALVSKLAAAEPEVLACMHGASYRGNGAKLLGELAAALRS